MLSIGGKKNFNIDKKEVNNTTLFEGLKNAAGPCFQLLTAFYYIASVKC